MLNAHIEEKRHGERVVLADLRLSVAPGEFVALSGPSGCGKTSLLHILAGLDKNFRGSLSGPGTLGMVFQDPRLLPWRCAADNIALAAPALAPAAIEQSLAAVGLAGMGHLLPRQLSLGMARRVALARALAVRPSLLLLDEPLVSLDEASAGICRSLIMEYWQAHRPMVVMVSHDAGDLAAMAQRVVRLG